jgi:signal transduction histidine kinase
MGHEACLIQCLSNLLDNALKFVPSGTTPDIRIESEINGARVRVSVMDNGIGIAPEHHASLFKLFGRLHPSHSYAGTGLGLAIVAKAVHRMGGTVGFNSEPGRGSTFWFELNVAPEQECACSNGQ